VSPTVVGGGRLGDVRHVVASPARAADRLGFRASEPFRPTGVAP
jgi:dTDP-L-rhamnose 4-epimerase